MEDVVVSTHLIVLNHVHRNGLIRIVLFSAVALWSSTSLRAADMPAKSWITIPGGLADPAGKVAYLASASDGIEAVDLESGQAIWESKDAQRPLALAGDQIIGQAPRGQAKINTINIIVLDAPSGKVISRAQPIVLPEWIAVDGGIGLSFSSTAAMDGNDLVISWHAERQFAKGVTFAGSVPPTQEAMAAARKIESGEARVDLGSGATSVTLDRIPQPIKAAHTMPYYDVGDKRISLVESPENLPGGIRIVHCLLDARSTQTGRPLWKHEIAGEIILPDVPPTAQPNQPAQQRMSNAQQPQRRQ
jgi:hypothetical protein